MESNNVGRVARTNNNNAFEVIMLRVMMDDGRWMIDDG